MKSPWYRVAVVGALVLASVAVMSTRKTEAPVPVAPADLPRLLELGSTTCVPCKQMEPVLDELRHEYAGKLRVEFVDVLKEKHVAKEFGIDIIPTQIFFDAQGNEIFRHTGFFPKEEILAAFKKHGIDLSGAATAH